VTIDQAITRVQFAYPQIYYACHTRHARQKSTPTQISQRDSEILVHLDCDEAMTLGELARHMDLAPSTLSEAVSDLARHGFVAKAAVTDRRRVALRLTPQGVAAVRATSVLEPERIARALRRLTVKDRERAVTGLALLAQACRKGR